MKRDVYYRGKPGKKYGIWNDVKKEFQFGICEDTPMLAEARLFQKLGDDARKYRFQPRMLPDSHKFQVADIVSDSVKEALVKMDRNAHGGRYHLIANGVTVEEQDGCEYCTHGKKITADIDGDIEIVKIIPLPAIDLTTGEQEERADPPYWAMRLMLDGGEDFAKVNFCPMCGRKLPEPPKEVDYGEKLL